MLGNIGDTVGLVLVTDIMTTYNSSPTIIIKEQPLVCSQLVNSTEFNIFIIGIALTIAVMVISLGTKNYTFKKQK